LSLVVEDTGKGLNPLQTARGLGLVNMRERAALVGGTLAVEPRAGGGTCVRMTVPV